MTTISIYIYIEDIYESDNDWVEAKKSRVENVFLYNQRPRKDQWQTERQIWDHPNFHWQMHSLQHCGSKKLGKGLMVVEDEVVAQTAQETSVSFHQPVQILALVVASSQGLCKSNMACSSQNLRCLCSNSQCSISLGLSCLSNLDCTFWKMGCVWISCTVSTPPATTLITDKQHFRVYVFQT